MALCPKEGGKVVTEQPHPLRELSVSNTTPEAAVPSGVGTAPEQPGSSPAALPLMLRGCRHACLGCNRKRQRPLLPSRVAQACSAEGARAAGPVS